MAFGKLGAGGRGFGKQGSTLLGNANAQPPAGDQFVTETNDPGAEQIITITNDSGAEQRLTQTAG